MRATCFPKLVIVLLAILLRFWNLSQNPPGLYVDEAVQGYNAYSLLQTGRDQYDRAFPLATKMFATYSAPLYTYYSVLPIKLFGLNVFSTRISSAIFGILLVIITVFYFGNLAGLTLAITPVFVFFSRAAFEANLGLFLIVLSLILFRRQKYPLAFLLLSLSAYAYHAQKLFFIPIAGYYLYKTRFKYSLWFTPVLPLFYLTVFTSINARFSELAATPFEILRNILVYLSPDNLFSRPDPDLQRSFPELSVFYWWMVFPLLIKFFKLKYILLYLFLLVPGIITRDYFSTIRVLPAFFLLALIISKGLKNVPFLISGILCLVSLLEFYSNLILLKHERSQIWGYQYQQLFSQIHQFTSQKILIDSSRQKPLYILLAYHQKIAPKTIQNSLYIANYYYNTDFSSDFTYQNITIKPLDWQKDLSRFDLFIGDTLAISDSQAKEHNLHLISDVPLKVWAKD